MQQVNRIRATSTASLVVLALLAVTGWGLAAEGNASEDRGGASNRVITGVFSSDQLPRPMNYGVLLPEGYEQSDDRYPVLFILYPGPPESHLAIHRWQPHIELARLTDRLPKVIVVTPAIDMSMYQAPQGDGRIWERAFVGPFLKHLHEEFRLWQQRPAFYATGLSAGGAITLRLGLRHPQKFGGIAVLAPGIEAADSLDKLDFEDTFWRPQNAYEGVDADAWAKYHPLNIARTNAEQIRSANFGIYLETGDVDSFELDRGSEIMHRVLRDNGIPHEYRLRQGVDHHVGTIMPMRWQDAYAYLGNHMRSPSEEEIVGDLQEAVGAVRAQARKNIPGDPKINRLRMRLFGFSRRQSEVEAEVLERLIEEARQQ